MVDLRLSEDDVYRLGVASPLNFANWELGPTVAEMNSNAANLPGGLIFNLTCALEQDGTQFDLDDPDLDDSLTFCQKAGGGEVVTENATVVFDFDRSKRRWMNAANTTVPADPLVDGYDTSNLALSLLAWRGIELFAWLSIGKPADAPFAAGDHISLVRVVTDNGVDSHGTGDMVRMVQTFGFRSDVLWNGKVRA